MTPRVVLDANVLYPFTLRDTLLRSAEAGLCQVFWSAQILDEATRNLVSAGRMTARQAERLSAVMRSAFPEALVENYECHIPKLENEVKDKHVAAAAVEAGVDRIITFNLRDFVPLPTGLRAQGPGEFLLELLEASPARMLGVLRAQAAALKRPPVSLNELLFGLGKSVPGFASQARQHLSEVQ